MNTHSNDQTPASVISLDSNHSTATDDFSILANAQRTQNLAGYASDINDFPTSDNKAYENETRDNNMTHETTISGSISDQIEILGRSESCDSEAQDKKKYSHQNSTDIGDSDRKQAALLGRAILTEGRKIAHYTDEHISSDESCDVFNDELHNERDSILARDYPEEISLDSRPKSPSYLKGLQHSSWTRRAFARFKSTFSSKASKADATNPSIQLSDLTDSHQEDKDLLTGSSKYHLLGQSGASGLNFRGSYRYHRVGFAMSLLKKLFSQLVHRSTLALVGAILIHITLGTVYTLSNINSYLTSYMRKHGSPTATYGSSMYISSLNAIGQGFSMVLGGYIEKHFSARISCIIGCILHSGSVMLTSQSIKHGSLAVFMTYGFIPGFGCGLAYMTPMSNGFGWFPNRRGFVAGIILAGFGIGTFIFNMAQTAYVNPGNLSPLEKDGGYFTQETILDRVPDLFLFIGSIYAAMQFIGCCLLFSPPVGGSLGKSTNSDERPIITECDISLRRVLKRREFVVLFFVYGLTTQGVLFVNSMMKEYGQIFINSDMYLAWVGSMASIANSLGRLLWGLAIDRFTFTQCFTSITIIFGSIMFIMPFEFVLSSRLLYLICTLGLFGSFSGWMSTYPVHLSRVFGRTNSGIIYGLIFVSQAWGSIFTALGAHYLIDHFNRFVPFFCVVTMEIIGLLAYHLFYPK